MEKKTNVLVVVLLTTVGMVAYHAFTNFAQASDTTENKRILAVATNEGADGKYDNAIATVGRAGVMAVSLPQPWDEIETRPGKYEPKPNFLAIANLYYPRIGMRVALGINPLDTTTNRVPAYLKGKPFDDPAVSAAYKRLLDYVFSQIPDLALTSLSIGNEIDGVLRTPEQWAQYSRFFAEVAAYARMKRKGLKVGTKGMFHGMVHRAPKAFQAINAHTDVVMVTYYPLHADFTVRPPSVIHTDFAKLLALYPGREIYVMEIGYPSGKAIGSSEQKQAEFVHEAFKLWDHYADRIGFMEFTWLHDQAPSSLEYYKKYYRSSDTGFVTFLATLGLRTHDNRDKQAFRQLVQEAKTRGWK